MSIEEAINVINTWIEPMRKTQKGEFAHEFLDAVEVLKSDAIKRNEPEKVGKRELRKYEWCTPYFCPNCEADLDPVSFITINGEEAQRKVSFCWCCGTPIDWSEHDE